MRFICPVCGVTDDSDKAIECGGMDVEHVFVFMIPDVEPLAVPEETTWGETGGAKAVTCEGAHLNTTIYYQKGAQEFPVSTRRTGNSWSTLGFKGEVDVVKAINAVWRSRCKS